MRKGLDIERIEPLSYPDHIDNITPHPSHPHLFTSIFPQHIPECPLRVSGSFLRAFATSGGVDCQTVSEEA